MFAVQTLAPIFVGIVLPVFLVAAAGYLLASNLTIDSRSVGRLLFYLATPALVLFWQRSMIRRRKWLQR